MPPVRQSNLERSKWRARCREQLSIHIFRRLGITIEPSQVRLLPRHDDPYTWKVLPGKEYLFSKNISEQSINVYKELCEGIDIIFEAVPTLRRLPLSSNIPLQAILLPNTTSDMTFTTTIENLEEQNQKLRAQVQDLQGQLTIASDIRQLAEEQVFVLQAQNQQMERQLAEEQASSNQFEDISRKYLDTLEQMASLLHSTTKFRA